MNFSLSQIISIGLCYGLLIFLIGFAGERNWIGKKITRHPLTYVLSVGVFASAWAAYGSVSMAYEYGYGYLSYYIGVAAAFAFSPIFLKPILRICQLYQLTSIADLFAFRYRHPAIGGIVTLFLLMSVMPLIALQLQAISDVTHILSNNGEKEILFGNKHVLGILFSAYVVVFAIIFGSHHITIHERHDGLIATMAFESLVKIICLLILGGASIYGVFGDFSALDSWLIDNEDFKNLLANPLRQDSGFYLLCVFFAAVVAMPNMFHMTFAENPSAEAIHKARWGVPLMLLLMSIPVLPILWAGFKLNSFLPPAYYSLAIGMEMNSAVVLIAALLVGLSAASSATIVTVVALASMSINHLVLPFVKPKSTNIYTWLLTLRRAMMMLIMATGYAFYTLTSGQELLSQLGIVAFVGSIQFLPGCVALLYWSNANSAGFLAGCITGIVIWTVLALLPISGLYRPELIISFVSEYFGFTNIWSLATFISLSANIVVFVVVSSLTKTSNQEKLAARICSLDSLARPERQPLSVTSPTEMIDALTPSIGQYNSRKEVYDALRQLNFDENERRPFALRQIRNKVKANLSRLMGPAVALEIVSSAIPSKTSSGTESATDINLIETRIDSSQNKLKGIAADLNRLRRYHRQTLEELPVGVCSVARDGEMLLWNNAMAFLTRISREKVIGSYIADLPSPWNHVLAKFISAESHQTKKEHIKLAERDLWISLHKAVPELSVEPDRTNYNQVIVVEDVTEMQLLENELVHNERLASIGRLAAGVAHEIGNPVTGIACLAQNLQYDTEHPESIQTGQEILQQTARISAIVQNLVSFAHAGPQPQQAKQHLQPVEISACIDEAIYLLKLNKDAKDVRFINQCVSDIYIFGDSQRLQQVFVNLLNNARDASQTGGSIRVTGYTQGNKAYITVTDEGSGIRAKDLEKVFEPFYTTKEAGDGTGLGLAMVYSIIEDFGGQIHIESPAFKERNIGTQVNIELSASFGRQKSTDEA